MGNRLLGPMAFILRQIILPVVMVVACAGIRFGLAPWLGDAQPFIFFYLAVLVSAFIGGLWAGALATMLSLMLGRFYFINPKQTFATTPTDELVRCGMFLLLASILNALTSYLGKMLRQSEIKAASLRDREARLHALWDTDVIGVLRWDLDGRVLEANDAYLRITGYSREDLLAGRVNWIDLTPAEYRRNDTLAIEELRRKGFDTPFEKEYIRKDGSRVWVLVGAALTGETTGVSYCLNVHERKLAEQERRSSDERVRLAGEAAGIGFWTYDFASRQLSFDLISRILYDLPSSGDLVGDDARARIHPDDLLDLTDAAERSVKSAVPYAMEYRVILRDGSQRWIQSKGNAVRDRDGVCSKLTGVHWDVTEQKRIERERDLLLNAERTSRAQAERANRIKDEFLLTLSHELRTPLNAVLGWAQVLKRNPSQVDMVSEGLGIIEQNARLQAQLIEDLLDMSRIVSGKVKLEIQCLSLADCVKAAIDSIRPDAALKEINVVSEFDETQFPVRGDMVRLQQVFWNLLSNAVKFTPKKGEIRIRIEALNSSVRVTVADNGVGMQQSFLMHAFDRFTQQDPSTVTRRHGGLGLGLSIVKQLVELHGGQVAAHSDGENRGSSFFVTLPLASDDIPTRT
jgi:PAS domain S-box-containing protein